MFSTIPLVRRFLSVSCLLLIGLRVQAAGPLELKPGDKIVVVGNTLAERLQYSNDWETHLHARFPQHNLTVRNLGFSGDTVTIRLRSQKFQDHGHQLTDHQPTVILALFGFNESFAGEKGLPQFEKDLAVFLQGLKQLKYPIQSFPRNRYQPQVGDKPGTAQETPRIVLCSPIANEDLPERGINAGTANNPNLKLYTSAMAKVAAAEGVAFVDLFLPTLAAFDSTTLPLTINGCHLNQEGERRLAAILNESLFGPSAARMAATQKLQEAVAEKNLQFFYDYRAVNGCYIYGSREAPFGVVNFPAEFEKLRKMTALRDQRIWSVAKGETVPAVIDDSQTGGFPEITTNFRNQVVKTSPEEGLKMLTLKDGFVAELFADEVRFPNLENPVQFTFDARGRLWVVTMPTYPQYLPGEPVHDKILIYEDVDGDGRADKETVFATGLHLPTGIEVGDGGVYVGQQPNLMFLKDTDGDDVADVREIKLHGLDSADSHHAVHAFEWGPEGALYFQEGTFHHTQIETPYGLQRLANAGVFRYEPERGRVDVFANMNFDNPWGHAFDDWGQDVIADASPGRSYLAASFSGRISYPNKHPKPPEFLQQHMRPSCGIEFISSRNFPDEMQGDCLINNCIGFQGVLQYRPKDQGSAIFADQVDPLLRSEDPNFRPVDLQMGPDGALYVVDWYNPLVGHMQHSLRDPNRDKSHGRIFRIRYSSRQLVTPSKIAGESIPALLDLLKLPEQRTRYRARTELRSRNRAEVLAAAGKWIAGLDRADPRYEHHLLEAVWVQQHHFSTDPALLNTLLATKDPRARAAAVRLLSQQLERIPEPLALLQKAVHDDHPRVRLEAVRALSFFDSQQALDIAVESLVHDQDPMLTYTLKETMDELQRRIDAKTAAK